MGWENDRFQFGLTTRGGPLATDELTTTRTAAGAELNWVLWFELFGAGAPVAGITSVDRLGARPIITWEPWFGESRRASVTIMPETLWSPFSP